jgi:ribosomal protein S25
VGTEEVVGTDGTEVAEKTGNESAAVHEAGVAVTAVPETESSVDGVVPSTDVTVRDTTQTVTDSSVLEKSAVEQSVAPVQSGSGNPSKKVWSREYVAAKIEKLQAARDARVREIADDIQKNGAVTIKEVRTRYHVTRQTAYAYMRELVKKGLAVRKKVISFVRPGGK